MDPIRSALKRLHEAPNDQVAWGELFRLTYPFVLSLCHRSLPASRRVYDAEDVAQEVYLKFARYWKENRPAIDDRDTLLSLLAVMTRQLSTDSIRWETRARRDVGMEEPLVEAQTEDVRSGYAEVEIRDLLDTVSSNLDSMEASVLHLRIQGYGSAEIAKKLQVSPRTIERKLTKIRGILRPYLELGDPGDS